MTTGGKIAIIIGGTLTLIGGGLGIYFLTRGKSTTSTSSSSSSDSSTLTNEKLDKVTGTINSTSDLIDASTGLWGAISGLFGSKSGSSSSKTEIPSAVSKLASDKTLQNVYQDNSGTKLYVFTDGTYVKMYSDGTAVKISKFVESDWTKISANGEQLNATAISKKDAQKKMSISKNGVFQIK